MLKKLFVLAFLLFVLAPEMGFSQTSPVEGTTWAVVDTTTAWRIIGGYRSENNIAFFEPTTGNFVFTSYYLKSADPSRRTITAAVSTDGGLNWSVTRQLNAGVGDDPSGYYPVAYGTESTPIIAYYNRANSDPNIVSQPIVVTDAGGWGVGVWNNMEVDAVGTEADKLDFRYNTFAIAPDNSNLWLLGGIEYEPGLSIGVYRSTDGGASWSSQIKVVSSMLEDTLSSNYVYSFTGNRQPLAMSMAAGNKVYGVFQAKRQSSVELERAMYVVSNDGGLTWTDPAFIPGTESLMFNTDDTYRSFSTLMDNAGNWHVFGVGFDTTEVVGDEIPYRVWNFKFDGSSWNINKMGFPQLLEEGIVTPGNTNSDEEDVMNSPAIGPDGTLYFAYTDVSDTTGAVGDPFAYNYGIYVMVSEDNGTTWQGPQLVFEEAGWASEYPCDQTKIASDKLHFFYRSGGGGYDEPKQMNYMAVPTQGIKNLISSVPGSNVSTIPKSHELFQNYPNPFNPNTTIRFNLKGNVHVKLSIYNVQGQLVATLIDNKMLAGEKGITWYAKDVTSGTYFYRLEAGDYTEVKEMTLIK